MWKLIAFLFVFPKMLTQLLCVNRFTLNGNMLASIMEWKIEPRIGYRKNNFDKRRTIIETEIKMCLMSFNLHIHVVYFSFIHCRECPSVYISYFICYILVYGIKCFVLLLVHWVSRWYRLSTVENILHKAIKLNVECWTFDTQYREDDDQIERMKKRRSEVVLKIEHFESCNVSNVLLFIEKQIFWKNFRMFLFIIQYSICEIN